MKMPLMTRIRKIHAARSFKQLCRPLITILPRVPLLESRCNRPLQMEFEHQLNALISFHLEEHTSGRHLIQTLQEDEYARNNIAPPAGIQKSSFIEAMSEPGQTGIMDRGYQCHQNFDSWQTEEKHFVCRIKANTQKTCLESYPVLPGSIVFYDAKVLLGQAGVNQTEKPLRLVGYQIGDTRYWVATDRFDLTAEQIAQIYKLRWDIEKFFGWWKRHLRVYQPDFKKPAWPYDSNPRGPHHLSSSRNLLPGGAWRKGKHKKGQRVTK